jgi:diamine N-acetyltransferase
VALRAVSVSRDSRISLREITPALRPVVSQLAVREDQVKFVAPNTRSLEQADADEGAWMRAIYADETAVGFVLLHEENLRAEPERRDYYYLWRFMIDQRYQGLGFGARAMQLVIGHVRAQPAARELFLHHVPAEGSAEGFYERLGFEHTGALAHGELEMRLALDRRDESQ